MSSEGTVAALVSPSVFNSVCRSNMAMYINADTAIAARIGKMRILSLDKLWLRPVRPHPEEYVGGYVSENN